MIFCLKTERRINVPIKSKSQFRLLQKMIHDPKGMKNKPTGLTKEKAQEFIDKTKSYKSLPEKVKKNK